MVKEQYLSAAELAALLATARQDPDRTRYRVLLTEDGQLVLPPPTPVVLEGHLDSAGRVRQGSAAGSMPVVEASAAGIATSNTQIYGQVGYNQYAMEAASPYPPWALPAAAALTQRRPRQMFTTLTATAGGEIAAAAIAPAITGYRTCMCLTHVFSDQTTANITGVFATTSGLTDGLAGMDISTVANTVAPDYNRGLFWRGSAITEAITFACAAGQAGNAQNITFIGAYWGESV